MDLSKATHKALLYLLFYTRNEFGLNQKQFPIGKLLVAASTAKKLLDGTTSEGEKTLFVDGLIQFKSEEWVFLKELFAQKADATISEAESMEELKKIFAET